MWRQMADDTLRQTRRHNLPQLLLPPPYPSYHTAHCSLFLFFRHHSGNTKRTLELYGAHTPCAATLSCMLLESCLAIVYKHVCITYTFQFCRKRMGIVGSAVYVAVILSAIVHCMYFMHCLFVTLLISSCHHSYHQRILIYSQRARACRRLVWHQRARARASRMHMQIIAVGVTNRRYQQKSTIYSFRGPLWTTLTHVRAFSCYF